MRLRLRLLEVLARRLDGFFRNHLSIGPTTVRGKRFGKFGTRSVIVHPVSTVYNEEYIEIGNDTMIGPNVSLAAGMVPGQRCLTNPVVKIGDRCLIGRDSSIVGHYSIVIEDDVWTGPRVYITDQNHGYEDVTRPISVQTQPERPVLVGAGSWIGAGAVLLPGATIGRHCTIGANAVVTGIIPDHSVAVGVPARVIRRYTESSGWVAVKPTDL